MTKREYAVSLFEKGYNCAQAVFGAFSEDLGMDFDTAMKFSSAFGGGMGRLREVCGAVSGMFMVLSVKEGYTSPTAKEEKMELYKKVQDLAAEFKAKNGDTIICRELLKNVKTTKGYIPEERTTEYYHARPCYKFVGDAAEIMENYLNNN
ncbi:MAG: C_GCAxxG_C_C family protein [Clostridia bacterium]|nr:C_GCAxxG_C_C family protein [Clostridia bacterium]